MKHPFTKSTAALIGAAMTCGALAASTAPAQAADPFIGQIVFFGGNFAPRGWGFCDGQLLPISQFSALFSILGTTYGGDGETTFALPDMRGRSPVHAGRGPGLADIRLGAKSGNPTTTLSVANLPSHSHALNAKATNGNQNSPQGNFIAPGGTRTKDFHDNSGAPTAATMNSGSIGNTGGGQSFNNYHPYVAVNCIIATQGIFPSRS